MNAIFQQHVDRLAVALAAAGYPTVRQVVRKDKTPISVKFIDPVEDHAMTSQPACELYLEDAYPNNRDEIFLHVWNWIGMGVKATNLVRVLSQHGIEARVTTKNKFNGVAIKVPTFDWSKV